MQTVQTITDFIVDANGTLVFVSHRDSNIHIVNGASSTLIFQGLAAERTTRDISAWIGDKIEVLGGYGEKLFDAIVLAKRKRLWDMSKPIGRQRLVECKKSNDFDRIREEYSKSLKR